MPRYLFLVLLSGCSISQAPLVTVMQPLTTESIAMIGKYGIAHACPVEGRILTAAHVAESFMPDGAKVALGYTYQQGPRHGFLTGQPGLFSRDLSTMSLDSGDVAYYRIAYHVSVGDKITWQEFDLYNRPLSLETKQGKVISVTSGHFAFSPAPSPGASGGCVFNERGQVSGIVVWAVGFGRGAGVAVDITGGNRPWAMAIPGRADARAPGL